MPKFIAFDDNLPITVETRQDGDDVDIYLVCDDDPIRVAYLQDFALYMQPLSTEDAETLCGWGLEIEEEDDLSYLAVRW